MGGPGSIRGLRCSSFFFPNLSRTKFRKRRRHIGGQSIGTATLDLGMSFFGFETSIPQAPGQSKQTHVDEDLAVYTWGEDSYDGLGDALQEVGDDLNDVTFGGGAVGKYFIVAITHLRSLL